jgi:hypothetical protein
MNTQSQSQQRKPPCYDFGGMVRTAGNGLPSRLIIYGPSGIGKTSLAAEMPAPFFLQCGETGLETLINSGQLTETPHLPEFTDWTALLESLDWIRGSNRAHKTLVIDAIGGAERLCFEHVCERDFGGDWSERGFAGYQRGYEVALGDWKQFLTALDRIRLERKMSIVLLGHSKISSYKNPSGPDYDRYVPDISPKTWAMTHKWSDGVLFWNFETQVGQVQENKKSGVKKGKLLGQSRILYCQSTGAYDAKNRLGLLPEIDMGRSPQQAWAALKGALIASRKPAPSRASEPVIATDPEATSQPAVQPAN